MPNKRLHFGVILSTFDNTCQYDVWKGIVEYANQHNIHLTAYFGAYQMTEYDFASHFYGCFDTIKKSKSLDGIIILSGFIAQVTGTEIFEKYIAMLPKHLPIVSISYILPNIPSVLIDNVSGIFNVVDHLIRFHGKKQIVFIKGPDGHPEAEDRLSGYRNALSVNDIAFDERYILPGNFSQESGYEATMSLLESKLPFDAIAASDDETALGVLAELRYNDILVPVDVAVTGFDDDRVASTFIPSISTACQDFREIGLVSTETLLNVIEGKPYEDVVYVPPIFIARQSCGCLEREFLHAPKYDGKNNSADSLLTYVSHKFLTIFKSEIPMEKIDEWVTVLVGVIIERPFSKEKILCALNEILICYVHYSQKTYLWNDALNILTLGVEHYPHEVECAQTIHSTLILATTLVHSIRFKEEKVREFALSDERMNLRRIAGNLVLKFDMDSLLAEIKTSFPELSVHTTLIGLYNNPVKSNEAEADRTINTLIGFDGEQTFDIRNNSYEPIVFSDYSSIEHFNFENERRELFYIPLFFKDEEMGVLLMPYDPNMSLDAYEILRVNISAALKGANLLSKIQTLSITDELTGLLNRRGFFQFAYNKLKQNKRELIPMIMFLDMDGLKKINDTYGHSEGDLAISNFANILKEVLREEDIVGRIGGDEFVVFSLLKSKHSAELVEKRIRAEIDEYNQRKLHPYHILSSIGSVILKSSTFECFEAAMLIADDILYEEKTAKKKMGISRT
ncbi:MAG: diguanylate cyclase [Lachnospiraceae bacterium]|nr:diguanylate cyclase [Lachnospiraceae bacterium]